VSVGAQGAASGGAGAAQAGADPPGVATGDERANDIGTEIEMRHGSSKEARGRGAARTLACLLGVLLVAVLAAPLAAQAGGLGAQRLGRPYVHVFLAYAVLWVLVVGWIWAIARRIARLEARLREE